MRKLSQSRLFSWAKRIGCFGGFLEQRRAMGWKPPQLLLWKYSPKSTSFPRSWESGCAEIPHMIRFEEIRINPDAPDFGKPPSEARKHLAPTV